LISWKEVKIVASLAGPLILGNLLNFLLLLVSLTFVGHCGEIELSGASIANSFAVVTGFSVVVCV
jgi:MATE family multidrug resistance protein